MSKITDKELEALTIKMMEKTTEHYLNTYQSKESDDINKLIEKDVAMRIVDIVPNRYTEITVNVIDFFGDIEIAAVFKTDSGFKLYVDYEYVVPYDPTSLTETYYFGSHNSNKSRGSKVETLSEAPWFAPAGTARGIVDRLMNERITLGVSSRGNGMNEDEQSDLEYFRKKVMKGLMLPNAPTSCAPMTEKTSVGSEKLSEREADAIREGIFVQAELKSHPGRIYGTVAAPIIEKPPIDFSTISQLSPQTGGVPRYAPSMWAGVDLATVDVKQECIDNAAKRIAAEIDESILADVVRAAAGDTQWAGSTFGWSKDETTWAPPATPEAISWKTHASMLGYSPTPSEFGGVITTDNAAPVWYTPDTSRLQPIEFTEEDLDLLNMTGSQVMEFA